MHFIHRISAAVLLILSQFSVAKNVQVPLDNSDASAPTAYRVAILGAGAGGSSAAYYLRNFSNQFDLDTPLNITVFELNSRVGGRTTTVNAFDEPKYAVELGASIFVELNHILYNFTRDFGLPFKTEMFASTNRSDYVLGVWDGAQFLFKQGKGEGKWQGWWDIARLLWKYGLSPIRTQMAMRATVGKFLQFYSAPIFPFSTLEEAVEATDLLQYIASSGSDILNEAGVSAEFSRDIIEASTRVNYAQNLGGIHGLETMVCMATEGAMAVQGGNWQIFEEAVKHSKSIVHLNTKVTGVTKTENGTYTVHTNLDQDDTQPFDAIILAAPYQFTDITFTPLLEHTPIPTDYVKLHVTLFTSPHLLSPVFFDTETQAEVPTTILTAVPKGFYPGPARGLDAVGPAGFWSISMHGVLPHPKTSKPQYLYKVFSPAPITGTFLSSMLGFSFTNTTPSDPLSSLPKEDITWLHEKAWHSYPYEVPRTTFEHIRLDFPGNSTKHQGGRGVWYTSGIESFISTMETSALSGMNVARLLVDELVEAQQNEALRLKTHDSVVG